MPRRSQKNASRRKAHKSVRKPSKSAFNYARKDQRAQLSQYGVKDVQVTAPGSALEFRAPRMYLRGSFSTGDLHQVAIHRVLDHWYE